MTWNSALYLGEVVHARHRPRVHKLRYQVLSFLIDLDELPALDRAFRLFGYNRPAVFSFDDKDHGTGQPGTLKTWVMGEVAKAGIAADGLRVRVLCYPRILGYGFNPLTVYFCEDDEGSVVAVLYEVCNTFRERHTYVIPVEPGQERTIRHQCAKAMYVSPFVPMDCHYRFRIMPPQGDVMIAIDEHDAEGSLLYASFSGKRRELSSPALLRALVAYPLMTLKVMGAIHWEAFRLWAKGIPVHRHKKAAARIASSTISPREAMGGDTP